MKKIAITGANGYIGTRLSLNLAQNGYQVIALVDNKFSYDCLKHHKLITTIEFSLNDIDELNNFAEISDVDTLYHLAWDGVNAIYRNNAEIQVQNVLLSLKVMEFAAYNGIKRVIIPGSAAEAGNGDGAISGNEKPSPTDMYSASKVACRYICKKYAEQQSIDLIWCLITSVLGPGRNDNNLITYVVNSFLTGEQPATTKLEQEWDYIYIDDLIKALVLIGDKGLPGKVYPIGSGVHKKLREYVETIRDIINPALKIGIGEIPYKNSQIDNQIIDISELQKDTGFVAEYTFYDGMTQIIKEKMKK